MSDFPFRSRSLAVAALAAALVCTPGSGRASGFQIRENSAQGLGRAFAGSAVSPGDLSVIAVNPAAMKLLQGTAMELDLSLVDVGLDFDGRGGDALGRPLVGGDGGEGGGLEKIPSGYFSMPLAENVRFGFSLTTPFGLRTEYEPNWLGRYQAIKSELRTLDATAALSFDVNDQLTVGAGLVQQYMDSELSKAIDFGAMLNGTGGFSPQSADGRITTRGDDRAWGTTLGVLYRFDDATRVGIGYRSEIHHTLRGDVDYDVPVNVQAALGGGAAQFANTHGSMRLTTPAVTTMSVYRSLNDRLALLADASFTQWSKFEELRLQPDNGRPDIAEEQDWHSTWFGSFGADYRVNETIKVRGGLAFDEQPLRLSHRSPRVPDSTERWLAVGMSWQPADATVVNVGYSHLLSNDARIANRSATGSALEGSFEHRADTLSVSVGYTF